MEARALSGLRVINEDGATREPHGETVTQQDDTLAYQKDKQLKPDGRYIIYYTFDMPVVQSDAPEPIRPQDHQDEQEHV